MSKTVRIACISDIHGNLTALKACLKDIETRNIDQIISLGDIIAKGFHNSECVKLVQKHCSVSIQGNCDAYFSRDLSSFVTDREKYLVSEYQKTLDADDLAYLAALPFSYECMLSGRLIRMVHAAPDSYNNYSANTLYASLEERYSMFLPSDRTISQERADVTVFGHVHEQAMCRLYNRMLVGVGSVGNALDFIRNEEKDAKISHTVNAQYTILEGNEGEEDGPFSVQFIQVPYDAEAELSTSRDFFEYEDLACELTSGNYRNHEKIRKVLLKDGIDIDQA